ncbi:MAG TPA: hypothetical protein VKU19_17010 [Bryobacteraceae bacterium]|nr:hypothetical protein [Bryobacteraceae bacterium]
MRALIASLLAALFSFALISPAVLASDAGNAVPACCRRAGEHGCALRSSQNAPLGYSAQAARCRFFPPAKSTTPGRVTAVPAMSQAFFAGVISHPASRPQIQALYRISYSRSRQERGPPTPLS